MKRLLVLAVLLGVSFGLFVLSHAFAGETAAVPSELPVKGLVKSGASWVAKRAV